MTITEKLIDKHRLTEDECLELIRQRNDAAVTETIRAEALRLRRERFGNDVYVRGLIEFTNICKNDCYYCGIRKSNPNLIRYRLTKDEILSACEYGYSLGFRTFVLQGGEDGFFDDEILSDLIREIKNRFPDCALTLSFGERSYDSYKILKKAGADRYLLRHETADEEHYRRLHPTNMSFQNRIDCLYSLKDLGYQVGAGFMVGSPYQTPECLAKDLVFLQDFQPEMVGIGPFVPHHETKFRDFPAGSVELTLFLLSVIRILLPDVLLPATTALGTLDPGGREKGMLAGANVVMPDMTPLYRRGNYELYNNKLGLFDDTKQSFESLKKSLKAEGFSIVTARGDYRASIKQ